MPRKKIPSYPIMNPSVAQTQQLCQPLSAKGKSNSEPSMRESSQAARNSVLASREDNGRLLSTFSLNDMGRGEHLRCDICQTSDTPEWRKGPNGPRTLCNACGLRYSKQVRKTDQPKKERSYEWFMYQAPDKVVKVDASSPLAQQPIPQIQIQQPQLPQPQPQAHHIQSIQANIPMGLSLSGPLPLPLSMGSPTLPRMGVDSPSCLVQAMAPLSLTQSSYSDSDTMDMEYTPETSAFSPPAPKNKSTKMKIDFLLN